MLKQIVTLAVAAVLGGSLAVAQQQTQGLSLAEIAKKNKERKAKRVITDDDLPSTRERAPETAPAAAAGGEVAASAPAEGGEASAQGEAKTAAKTDGAAAPAESEEIKKLKERIQSLRDEEAGYTKTADEAQERVNASTDEFRREMYSRVIANSRENARQLADQRQQLEAQLQAKQKPKSNEGEAANPPQ